MWRILSLCVCLWLSLQAFAFPLSGSVSRSLQKRTDPFFPAEPASCPICAKDYSSISSCAEAAPVFENFTMVLFNPGAFLDTIQCACTDVFKAVFPQCVDCFVRTGQDDVIIGNDLPAAVEGVRQICAISSVLLGNVTAKNEENANNPSSAIARLDEPLSAGFTFILALTLAMAFAVSL
ncbi:hypothetical protein FA15DRAFT_664442 [Coprinopsis marcescibilis]|uniref:Extracellular membrane protein CFEM domain-containing protein n=1 Tax=Coprinopsis marcescibilis TaxID=230819 RepID=A0A5C3L8J9_COPMA|nr:hypothetical protein FA15DRAFT_664442 [Coprinopsis marcescibilis]